MWRALLAAVAASGGLPLARAAVPTYPPQAVSFADHDLDQGQLGGPVEFVRAITEVEITYYAVFFGSSPTVTLSLLANIPKTGNPRVNLGYNFPLPAGATHFIVYSANAEGVAWGASASCALRDRAVPPTPPTGLFFDDLDYNISDIGGTVTLGRASDEALVTHYAVYFGSGPSTLMQALPGGLVPKATDPLRLVVANDTSVPDGATHLLAYTWNSDGNSQAPASLALRDRALPVHAATSIAFYDTDLGVAEVSGTITIGKASDEGVISAYVVYFARGASGPIDALLGTAAKTGADVTLYIGPDVMVPPGVSHVLVRTRSVDGEMAQGISTPIVDRAVPVHAASSVQFIDTDIDRYQLDGTVTIGAATNQSDITYYAIFFADEAYFRVGSALASLPKGPAVLAHALPLDTPLPPTARHLLVLGGNADGIALPVNGRAIALVDRAVPLNVPVSVAFTDQDTDPGEISGAVTMQRAIDESDVDSYAVYFGTAAPAVAASKYSASPVGAVVKSSLSSGYASFPIGSATPIPAGVTHFLVFSKNADGEIRTGLSVEIVDRTGDFPTTMVSALSLFDIDTTMHEIGGPLTWYEPASTAGLVSYGVYLAVDAAGTLRKLLASVAIGATLFEVPTNTYLKATGGVNYTHLLVYTRNTFGEALTGADLTIVDRALPTALVIDLAFLDQDAAVGFVGGQVVWTLPPNPALPVRFTAFDVQLADRGSGATLALGQAVATASVLAIPSGTGVENYTHVEVYAKNGVGRALVGAAVPLVDVFLPPSAVSLMQFFDQDLGAGELGGQVSWVEPPDRHLVDVYRVYLEASLHDGLAGERTLVGESPAGSTTFEIPFDTPMRNFTEVVVVAANAVGESIKYANVTIDDRTADSCPADYGHGQASSRWRLVAGPVDSEWRVRSLKLYSDALCAEALPTVPRGWPRRPRQLEGRPFASPPDFRNLHEIFMEQALPAVWRDGAKLPVDADAAGPWWSSGGPCVDLLNRSESGPVDFSPEDSACYIGFTWEANTFVKEGRVVGSTEFLVRSEKKVHCVEVVQSRQAGEFATQVALQWFDAARNGYRTLMQRRTSVGGLLQMSYQRVLAAECSR